MTSAAATERRSAAIFFPSSSPNCLASFWSSASGLRRSSTRSPTKRLCWKLTSAAELAPFGMTMVRPTTCFSLPSSTVRSPISDRDVDVEPRDLRQALRRVEELFHRGDVQLEPAVDARVVGPARRRLVGRQELLRRRIDVGRAVEEVVAVLRLAADLRPERVVVHERRVRPRADERDVAVVAAAAVARLAHVRVRRARAQRLRAVLLPDVARHVVRVQRAAAAGADLGRERRLVVAEPVAAQPGLVVERAEVAVAEGAALRLGNARMAAGAVAGEHFAAARDRALAELLVEVGEERRPACSARSRSSPSARSRARRRGRWRASPSRTGTRRCRGGGPRSRGSSGSRGGTGRCRTASGRSCAPAGRAGACR